MSGLLILLDNSILLTSGYLDLMHSRDAVKPATYAASTVSDMRQRPIPPSFRANLVTVLLITFKSFSLTPRITAKDLSVLLSKKVAMG